MAATFPESAVKEADADAETGDVSPRNTLNDLSAREWLSESVSVWMQRGLGAGHADAQVEREHPAPFSFTDVARLIPTMIDRYPMPPGFTREMFHAVRLGPLVRPLDVAPSPKFHV